MFENMFEKALKKDKRSAIVLSKKKGRQRLLSIFQSSLHTYKDRVWLKHHIFKILQVSNIKINTTRLCTCLFIGDN